MIEQCLADLAAWVEDGSRAGRHQFDYRDGEIILPKTAAERGGIQPVVSVTANGGLARRGRRGRDGQPAVNAETPPGAGTIVGVQWDFDGTGTYPKHEAVDGKSAAVSFSTSHSYDKPGTYFVTALVESHRDGKVDATSRRVPNVASARVVVR